MEANSNGDDRYEATNSKPPPPSLVHPLQDVSLNLDDDEVDRVMPAMSSSGQKSNLKENWVKFDDEVSGDVVVDGSKNNNNKNNTNNNKSNTLVDSNSDTTTATATNGLLSPTPTSAPAPLLPPPATKERTTARARSPAESSRSQQQPQQQQQQQPSVASAPVQRTTVSSTTVPDVAPAVLTTESTHVNLNASGKAQQQQQQQQHLQHQKLKAANISASSSQSQNTQLPHHSNNGTMSSSAMTKSGSSAPTSVTIPVESDTPAMRTIELSTGRIREGFANGDVIVTLLPANTKWPWITPAIFRPELVPEELMAQGLTLTVEEYVNAMETLVNDYRFTVYNVCYKRILVVWILFAFTVLLALLFSGLQGVALFSLGVGWLFLNAAAIFLCMWVKLRLARGLEKCLARVNKQLMKHKILLILDDRGRISCHKVNLCFLYFDSTQCVNFLNEFLEHTEQNGGEAIKAGWEAKLDIDVNDIVIQGTNPVRLSRKQAVAQELFLSYLQRWGKDFLRRRLDWTVQEAGVHETPRHLQSSICPCQYEEEVLRNKIKLHMQRRRCFGINCIGCWM